MNISHKLKLVSLGLISAVLLSACASAPKIDPRLTALESKLMVLESNTDLASRGGDALKTAQSAVRRVAGPNKNISDEELAYRFYAADRLITAAELTARAKLAEDRRKDLVNEQEKLVLEARTLEADLARKQAQEAQQSAALAQQSAAQAKQSAADAMLLRERALAEAAEAQKLRDEAELARAVALESQRSAEGAAQSARTEAEIARSEAETARMAAKAEADRAALAAQRAAEETERANKARADAEAARAESESLRNRLSEMEAKQTERGLLITLGDVLFEFNKSDLKPGVARNLLPLAEALKERPDQTAIIEGHTDSIGSHAYNMTLSEKRAIAVQQYLVTQGVNIDRITSKGLGPDFPVADNATDEGRQRNRRVEVILPNLN